MTNTASAQRHHDSGGATIQREITGKVSERSSHRAFLIVSVLLFVASASLTIVWCESMSSMGDMPMPGGWKMSMAWTRMPGQTWLAVAASFLGMWIAMMVAMMLPSLVLMLRRYREVISGTKVGRLDQLTALVGSAYFLAWTAVGMVVFLLGVTLAALEMQHSAVARAVPTVAGMLVLIAGTLQFTAWKAHHLACCRGSRVHDHALVADGATAWKHGLRLGVHCMCCCAGLTAVLMVIGVMDLRTMAVVMAAITAERMAPDGKLVARALGAIAIAVGLYMIARPAGLV